MSNYPPTPSFGGPFNFAQRQVPPSPAMQRPDFRPQSGAKPQTIPSASNRASNAVPQNTATYDANSRLHVHGGGMAVPPPPPTASFLKQFANSSLPPPPFPPVPIPHFGFPPFPLVPPSLNAQPIPAPTPSSHLALTSVPEVRVADMPLVEASVDDQGAREEGELSDGELNGDTSGSERAAAPNELGTRPVTTNSGQSHSQQQAASVSGELEGSTNLKKHSLEMSTGQGQRQLPGNQFDGTQDDIDSYGQIGDTSLKDDGSDTSYHPRSPSPLSPTEDSPYAASFQKSRQAAISVGPVSRSPSSLRVNGSATGPSSAPTAATRQAAKAALLGLAAHKISFVELVKEGVDPTVLSRLYEELKLPYRQADAQAMPSPPKAAVSPSPVVQVTKSSHLEGPPNTRKPVLDPIQSAEKGSLNPQREEPAAPIALPQPSLDIPATTVANVNERITHATSVPSPGPLSTVPVTDKEDRKDRIARLLAAKTGKPLPPRADIDKVDPGVNASVTKSSHKPSHKPSPQPLPKSLPVVPMTTPELTQQPPHPIKPITAPLGKEKNKAKTDLVRERLDLLKKQGLARTQANTTLHQPDQSISHTTRHETLSQVGAPPQSPGLFSDTSTSLSRIPGLFMTDSTSLAIAEATTACQSPSAVADTELSLDRPSNKRSRASDSIEVMSIPAKRPFGKRDSDDVDITIVLSEDEMSEHPNDSEDVEMYDDEDEREDLGKSIEGLINENSLQRVNQHLPPLSSVQATQGSNATRGTTPLSTPHTPSSRREQEELRRKNDEILAMRKKIAEMELRRRAKQTLSRVQSPAASRQATQAPEAVTHRSPNQQTLNATAPESASVHIASNQTTTATKPDELSRQTLVAMRVSSSPPAPRSVSRSPAEKDEAQRRLQRKREIESGLPLLDAEVGRTQSRLAVLQAEARRLEAELEKGIAGRKALMMELEDLGMDTDTTTLKNMTINELQDKRDELVEQKVLNDLSHDLDDSRPVSYHGSCPDENRPNDTRTFGTVTSATATTVEEPLVSHKPPSQPGLTNINSRPEAEALSTSQDLEYSLDSRDVSEDAIVVRKNVVDESASPSDSAMEESSGDERSMYFDGNDADGPQIEETYFTMQSPNGEGQYEHRTVFATTQPPEEEGQYKHAMASSRVQSSEEEDQYEPELARRSPSEAPVEVEATNTGITNDTTRPSTADEDYEGSVSMSDDGSDVYEPPEPSTTTVPKVVPSPSLTPVLHEVTTEPVDDGETHLQLIEADTVVKAQNVQPPTDAVTTNDETQPVNFPRASHFQPYESPLKLLKAYRYNPRFTVEVPGGHRSLTYSHNTDPRKVMCIYETAGGICNDPNCPDQHFRQIALPDDKILAQMGNWRDESQSPEERDQYVTGLKQIISDLRKTGVKDFDMVAQELANYRRRFQEERDPSRALPP